MPAVLSAPSQIQTPDPQRAQRAASPALPGPAKPSVLLKPSLLMHSPSRLSRMTPRASLQDDNSGEGSGQGMPQHAKHDHLQKQTNSFRSIHSQGPTPQGSGTLLELGINDSQEAASSTPAVLTAMQAQRSTQDVTAAAGQLDQHWSSSSAPQKARQPPGLETWQAPTPQAEENANRGRERPDEEKQAQDWEQADQDDIAAAVAQYTGARPENVPGKASHEPAFEFVSQQAQHEAPQLRRGRPQLALQHGDGYKKSQSFHRRESDSDQHAPDMSYAQQQAQMETELEAAMLAEQAPTQDTSPGRGMSKQYASPMEQMEAELEAAMAADTAAGGSEGGRMYDGGQTRMEADMESAMAADAAASGEDNDWKSITDAVRATLSPGVLSSRSQALWADS